MKITTSSISNVTIFGNHSSLQYPHAWDAKYNDNGIPKSVVQKLDNDHWLKNTFVDVVRERGHQIIKNKKSASGCSVAKAILDHLVMWNYGSQNEIISIGLESKGEYGVPDGLFFNFPTKISDSGTITVDTSIGISDYDKEILQLNIKELQSEKDLALSIVQEVLEPKLLKNKNK
ncbi:hypothetical protein A3Q56_02744 [Intoshia linei]|uniref:Lactate/malate dehydrogenase C-terminal domain-containing protein n=1 Tax=Intoshia linei TaxID=1819745 RepID=A0A177B5E9_9BILA|nr:hypothetical protein A3Q56_02744 [Intoshia linei]